MIGTGFVVRRGQASSQIDLLVVDRDIPTLFKDGDLLIVTPEAVRAIVEVKTTLSGASQLGEACEKLSNNLALCHTKNKNRGQIWSGIFVYEGSVSQAQNYLAALNNGANSTRVPINCIGHGSDLIIHFDTQNRLSPTLTLPNTWASWIVPGLAVSYFIGLMLNHWSNIGVYSDAAAWLPGQPENRPTYYLQAYGEGEIQEYSEEQEQQTDQRTDSEE